jgi:hypothetical protein
MLMGIEERDNLGNFRVDACDIRTLVQVGVVASQSKVERSSCEPRNICLCSSRG